MKNKLDKTEKEDRKHARNVLTLKATQKMRKTERFPTLNSTSVNKQSTGRFDLSFANVS